MQTLHLIAGLGKTGFSIARYLQRRQQPFVAFDTRELLDKTSPDLVFEFKQAFPQHDLYLGTLPHSIYPQLSSIICSPGVALDCAVLSIARDYSIPILGDIECFAQAVKVPVLAITGTNGKSTVTTLLGEMAKTLGKKVAVAGNIGSPVLDRLDDGIHYDLWVLELSSFQLDLLSSLSPIGATILNVTPDHLDRHHSFLDYVRSKQRIYHHAAHVIYNRADENTVCWTEDQSTMVDDNLPMCRPHPHGLSCQQTVISFGLDAPPTADDWGIVKVNGQLFLAKGKHAFLAVNELRIKGRHNWENALAACALASVLQAESQQLIGVLREFPGLPHRTQWVRTLNQVDWINDSKGTNIGAAISAINGIGSTLVGKIILIAGGQGKGADFNTLRDPVSCYVRCIFVLGQDAHYIEAALKDIVMITPVNTLEEAVQKAHACADAGDVVLLSPACASLDMFRDFNHRGEAFTTAVARL